MSENVGEPSGEAQITLKTKYGPNLGLPYILAQNLRRHNTIIKFTMSPCVKSYKSTKTLTGDKGQKPQIWAQHVQVQV